MDDITDKAENSKTPSRWQYLIGGLFALAFLATLVRFLFFSTDRSTAATVLAVMTGGLLLVAVLPQIAEFSIGLKGVSAKLERVENKVDKQQ